MTRDEAKAKLNEVIEWSKFNRYPYVDDHEVEAIKVAIKVLEQIEKIKSIINDPFYFRDMPDYLLRYKAICEVLKEERNDQR